MRGLASEISRTETIVLFGGDERLGPLELFSADLSESRRPLVLV